MPDVMIDAIVHVFLKTTRKIKQLTQKVTFVSPNEAFKANGALFHRVI